jgi:DNA-binding transcriptional LysR family regulator
MGTPTTLKAACAAGDGASVLSELAVAPDLAAGTLVPIAVDGLDLRREFRALWRASAPDPEVRRFVGLAARGRADPDPRSTRGGADGHP